MPRPLWITGGLIRRDTGLAWKNLEGDWTNLCSSFVQSVVLARLVSDMKCQLPGGLMSMWTDRTPEWLIGPSMKGNPSRGLFILSARYTGEL